MALAKPLGLPKGMPAKSLRYRSRGKGGTVERELRLLFDLDPATGEPRPKGLALLRHSIFPKGRTEYEEEVLLRLAPDGSLERAAYSYGRVLMGEERPLDLESARAKRLYDEELRFFLVESLRLKPSAS